MSGHLDGQESEYYALLRRLKAALDDLPEGVASDRRIARAAGASPTSVPKWISGEVVPKSIDRMLLIVRFLTTVAKSMGILTPELAYDLDEDRWREAYELLMHRRNAATGAAVTAAVAASSLADMRLGHPIEVYRRDPLRFGIAQAIDAGADAQTISVLPWYVRRLRDNELNAAIALATSSKQSNIAVLVGEPGAGKTRSCWEAVKQLDDRWRIWQPLDPNPASAVLANVHRVYPFTVIWLDDLGPLLFDPRVPSADMAAAFRAALVDPRRAPLLVLGTMWHTHWERLSMPSPGGEPDAFEQARRLLAGHEIQVDAEFKDAEIDDAREVGKLDGRLGKAVLESEGNKIAQYLAGVPEGLRRYRLGSAPTRALVHVAGDAWRLGATTPLSEDALTNAALDYVDDDEEELEESLLTSLHRLSIRARGARGPLSRVRSQGRGARSRPPVYQLGEYLKQVISEDRRFTVPPASFWETAMGLLPAEDVAQLARAARDRGLWHVAAMLAIRAVEAGVARAGMDLLWVLGDVDPEGLRNAANWLLSRLDGIDADGVASLAWILEHRGLVDEGQRLRERAAGAANFTTVGDLHGFLGGLNPEQDQRIIQTLLARHLHRTVSFNDERHAHNLLQALPVYGAEAKVVNEFAWRLARQPFAASYWTIIDLFEQGHDEQARFLLNGWLAARATTDTNEWSHLAWFAADKEDQDLVDALLAHEPHLHVDPANPADACRSLASLDHCGDTPKTEQLLRRLALYAKNASVEWVTNLHMMARELRLPDHLTLRLSLPMNTSLLREAAESDSDLMLADYARLVTKVPDNPLVHDFATEYRSWPEKIRERALAALVDHMEGAHGYRLAMSIAAIDPLERPGLVAGLVLLFADHGDRDEVEQILTQHRLTTISMDDADGIVDLAQALHELDEADLLGNLLARKPWRSGLTASSARALLPLVAQHAPAQLSDLASTVAATLPTNDGQVVAEIAEGMSRLHQGEAASDLLRRLDESRTAYSPWTMVRLLDVAAGLPCEHQPRVSIDHLQLNEHREWKGIVSLLKALHARGDTHQLRILADKVSVSIPFSLHGTTREIYTYIKQVGLHAHSARIAEHAANSGYYDLCRSIEPTSAEREPYGREPDGNASNQWGWRDLER